MQIIGQDLTGTLEKLVDFENKLRDGEEGELRIYFSEPLNELYLAYFQVTGL